VRQPWSQSPQLPLLLWVSTQMPWQSVLPAAHTHVPPEQNRSFAHALPHSPQLRLSLSVETHTFGVPQASMPVGHWQVPSLQVEPPPQGRPQPPQLSLLTSVSTQPPLHEVRPAGQPEEMQVPALHV
jgi:hypothetical protein